jgi:hypothetical protein
MADRISKAFAVSGDKTAVPTDSTGTALSFEDGWSSAYELEVGVDAGARDIDRGQHNQLWNISTDNIKQWQEQAYPQFFTDIAYEAGATVRYTDDENYICHTAQAAGTLPTDHSEFINQKFFGAYSYAVSQLAGGNASLVGFIYIGQTVDTFEYLIYPGDGRIYARGSVIGTITADFDASDGTDVGLSGELKNIYSNSSKSLAEYGGTANAITLSSSFTNKRTKLIDGDIVKFRATNSNTGAATINLDGIGVKPCITAIKTPLPLGYIRTDVFTRATYDSTEDSFILNREIETGENVNGKYTLYENLKMDVEIRGVQTSVITNTSVGSVFWPGGLFSIPAWPFEFDVIDWYSATITPSFAGWVGYSGSPNTVGSGGFTIFSAISRPSEDMSFFVKARGTWA